MAAKNCETTYSLKGEWNMVTRNCLAILALGTVWLSFCWGQAACNNNCRNTQWVKFDDGTCKYYSDATCRVYYTAVNIFNTIWNTAGKKVDCNDISSTVAEYNQCSCTETCPLPYPYPEVTTGDSTKCKFLVNRAQFQCSTS
jgi:hypothetical protein